MCIDEGGRDREKCEKKIEVCVFVCTLEGG